MLRSETVKVWGFSKTRAKRPKGLSWSWKLTTSMLRGAMFSRLAARSAWSHLTFQEDGDFTSGNRAEMNLQHGSRERVSDA